MPAFAVALIIVVVTLGGMLSAAPAEAAASCGTMRIETAVRSDFPIEVRRSGGTCKGARALIRRWKASVMALASSGACKTNTCSDARPPKGWRCSNTSAGEQQRTLKFSECRRARVRYYAYIAPID